MDFINIPKSINNINVNNIEISKGKKIKQNDGDYYTVRLHSLAGHVVRKIFNILTFGFVQKSVVGTWQGKKIYVRRSDLQKSFEVERNGEMVSVKKFLKSPDLQRPCFTLEEFADIKKSRYGWDVMIFNNSVFIADVADDLDHVRSAEKSGFDVIGQLPPGGIYILARIGSRDQVGASERILEMLEARDEFKCVIAATPSMEQLNDYPAGKVWLKGVDTSDPSSRVECYCFWRPSQGDKGELTDPHNNLPSIIEEKKQFDLKKR